MQGGLLDSVKDLEIPATADALIEVFQAIDILQAKACLAVAEFDRTTGWVADGAFSCRSWLKAHLGLGGASANRIMRTARTLDALPVLAAHAVAGDIGGELVSAIASIVPARLLPAFAEVEEVMLPELAVQPLPMALNDLREWRAEADADGRDPGDQDRSTISLNPHFGGQWALTGSLSPDDGRTLDAAIRAATVEDAPDTERFFGERRADALLAICKFYLDNHGTQVGPVSRPSVVFVATVDPVTGHMIDKRTVAGQTVSVRAFDLHSCDSTLQRILYGQNGKLVDVSENRRLVSPGLRMAIAIRDGHCRFPGCDRPPDECEAHHVIHWQHNGKTVLENLGLLCYSHHGIVHRNGWTLAMDTNGTMHFTTPSGRTITTLPDRTWRSLQHKQTHAKPA